LALINFDHLLERRQPVRTWEAGGALGGWPCALRPPQAARR
jgi:hypothetical protein